ncbi:hypothetical protein [Halocatena halophila]|uniref:hypothetical protein n=1 Tax=Halocatena halophila TaxID=2814576 RepID=UPI002ED3CD93
MPGDVTLFDDGDQVPVVLEADGSGNVPQYGELVGIVGESDRGTHVSYPAAAGEAVGHLVGPPVDVDLSSSFSANEVIGSGMIKLRHAIDWFPTGGYSASVNDLVVADADGTVSLYDTAGGHTADMVFGRVWTTVNRAEGTDGKAAVIRRQ